MLSFLQRDLPAAGRVLFPGRIPPPVEQFSAAFAQATITAAAKTPDRVWAAQYTHPAWGTAEIAALRQSCPLPAELVDVAFSLSDDEKARARKGEAALAIKLRARHEHVLRDRKGLLFWLRAVMEVGGSVAIDDVSLLLWSQAMLDDELAHDADLDIESLYAIHAVQDSQDSTRVNWLHTHGLEQLGAFDFDILQPSAMFVANCGDPMRALAFAALEGSIAPDFDRFRLIHPGGEVRLVPADRYQAEALPEHRSLRESDSAHSGRRSVLCEPVGCIFGRWRSRPEPSRFLAQVDSEGFVVPFSTSATNLISERASQTFGLFRDLKEEFSSFDLPALVKLGYEVEGGSPTDREYMWFTVHRVLDCQVDATLVNVPHRVPSLTAGQREEFPLERLTDWTILSPEGPMTPRNISAARRLRTNRAMWQARIDAEKH
jgi:hypothetical protein